MTASGTRLSPLAILKQSSQLSLASVLSAAIAIPVTVVVGRLVAPETYGAVGYLMLWGFYAGLAKPGLISGAQREIPSLLGQNQPARALELQNVSVTVDLAFMLLPTVVLTAAAPLQSSPFLRDGMAIVALTFVVTGLNGLVTPLLNSYQKFTWLAVVRFAALLNPLLVLASVRFWGGYSLLWGPLAAGFMTCIVLLPAIRRLHIRFRWSVRDIRRLARFAVPWSALSLVMWGYTMSDRAGAIGAGLSLGLIGYYIFGNNVIRLLSQAFVDFTAVLQPVLWKELGRTGSPRALAPHICRLWLMYVAASCAAVTAVQAVLGPLIVWLVPRYSPSIAVMEVLAFTLVFSNSTQLPNLILNSVQVDRQRISLLVWAAGLAVNVVLVYFAARQTSDLTVVAAASMAADLAVAVVLYALAQRHLLLAAAEAFRFYGGLLGLAALAVAGFGIMHLVSLVDAGDPLRALLLRAGVGIALWSPIGICLWRASDGHAVKDVSSTTVGCST